MDTLQLHPDVAKQLETMIQSQKYIFVCVGPMNALKRTNETWPVSRWYAVQTGRWNYVRYKLECFGIDMCELESLEQNKKLLLTGRASFSDIYRGFLISQMSPLDYMTKGIPETVRAVLSKRDLSLGPTKQEIYGSSWANPNSFFMIVRCPLPWGARPWVPLEETSKYILLDHYANHLQDSEAIRDLQQLKFVDQGHFHGADRPIKMYTMTMQGPHGASINEVYYNVPPKEYICRSCQARGHHYIDACFLFSNDTEEVPKESKTDYKIWSTSKLKTFDATKDD
jgi:hypothetical protein